MASDKQISSSPFSDLPTDILVQIFPYLDAKSFLALCSTCKNLHEGYSQDATYWRHLCRRTFRVPNQPVVENDGVRWRKLYNRIFTQTRVFTWGNNANYRLGHSPQSSSSGPIGCQTPTEIVLGTDRLGVIADMQCGGWSTTFLTAQGTLHSVGVMNGMQLGHHETKLQERYGPHRLSFPVPESHSEARTEQEAFDGCNGDKLRDVYQSPAITSIRQFSSGRTHILALSDSGRIWSWYNVNRPALNVKFLTRDIQETSANESSQSRTSPKGRVRQVIAGWGNSSAYIEGVGIVVWDPVQRTGEEDRGTDTMLVMDHVEVPKTGYQRATKESEETRALGAEVGAVTNYIMLEQYVLFVTDIGKVFCGKFGKNNQVNEILELETLGNERDTPIEIQGSFRRFAIFKNGEVITAHQDYLDACWDARFDSRWTSGPAKELRPMPQKIPALQHSNVISVAFGDYHFLALHANGKITSYGTENRSCGALGLGFPERPGNNAGRLQFHVSFNVGRLRGIHHTGFDQTGSLLRHAYTHGREVWFGREKLQWLKHLAAGGKDIQEARERMDLFFADTQCQGEVSEWIEQEGRDWDKGLGLEDDDGLGSHFALGICAAGWHCGALVLVNDELAKAVRERCIVKQSEKAPPEEGHTSTGRPMLGSLSFAPLLFWFRAIGSAFLGLHRVGQAQSATNADDDDDSIEYTWSNNSFPRLKLSDGREMPGTVPFDEWRFGRPEWIDIDV